MMGQCKAEAAGEEREEGTAGRRRGRVMRILGEKGRGICQEEEEGGHEEAEGYKEEDEEEEEEEEGDCFFESLDRVQSSVSFAVDIPSSDDEDEEDDVRISFASAIAPPFDFRRVSFAAQDEVGCDTDDDRGGGQDFDYDIWMAEPMEMSLMERRRRLLQGMGLTSSKDLARSRSSIRSGRIPSFRLASSRLSSCATATDDATLAANAAAKAASASPASSPLPVIARCRSDTELAASVVRGSASPEPVPTLIRADSAPPSISDQRGLPRTWGMLGQEGGGRGTGTEGRDVENGPSLTLGSSVRIKNLDTGKEFMVSEISKDGTWGRLNDLQTGLQLTMDEFEKFLGYSPIVKELMRRVNLGCEGNRKSSTSTSNQQAKSSKLSGRKKGGWFKNIKFVASSMTGLITEKDKGDGGSNAMGKSSGGSNSSDWLKVHQHRKSYKELTGLYMCQEIHAHQGAIWTMKFSSDRRYLASAGEDRTVHVWQVIECDALSSSLRQQESQSSSHPHQPTANGSMDPSPPVGLQPSRKTKKGKSSKKSIPNYIIMPETIFSLMEKPVCSFKGHLDDVLDLSWSKSQHLLSSSMDKTVRLWDIESKTCLKLFAHNDYVTCIQFNPTDDNYFISGSLDAKVRIWSIPDRQVVDWSDLHEMVTAVCYTPDGQGALVGSHKGSCRYYKTSDYKLNQEAQIDIRSKKKKSHAKKITGFQFAPGNPTEVLITSADSQIRVFDGLDMIHKFRGFRNTSSQISASYTSDGKYVVCASEDSHVYIWKRDPARSLGAGGKSKGWSTTRSHEHFFCKDVSVAIPWPGSGSNFGPTSPSLPLWSRRYTHERGESSDSQISTTSEDNFPISRSHYPPLPKKNSSEQTLPCADEFRNISRLGSEIGSGSFISACSSSMRSGGASSLISDSGTFSSSLSSWGWSVGGGNRASNSGAANAWGLVVVTASLGGDIRIYQNFGLPLRLSRQTNLFY